MQDILEKYMFTFIKQCYFEVWSKYVVDYE